VTGNVPGRLDPHRRARLLKSATYASVTVATSLVATKAWAWVATGSVSVLSSLADSLLDVLASGLTFFAIRYSLAPADPEHRFGHGKSEGLAALIQAAIISASAVYVCYEAVRRLVEPSAIVRPEVGLWVIGFATIATLLLVTYQNYVSRLTRSVAISADAMHYKADLLVNLGVGAAILLSAWTGLQMIDPLVGLGVAAYIVWGSVGIAHEALDILLDREIPEEARENIREIALAHPEVLGFHDMRTRYGGANYIVQFHLEMEPAMPLLRTHEILDEVEDEIRGRYPGCEIIIHADPLGLAERRDRFD